jgi:hypothetical protein
VFFASLERALVALKTARSGAGDLADKDAAANNRSEDHQLDGSRDF